MTSAPLKSNRLVTLDVLRGVAVIGIVFMNIFFFSMPSAAYFNPRAWGGLETMDVSLWALSFIFIEDKMRGLFALLFGASVLLLLDKDAGNHPMRGHYSRMGALLILGFAHSIFLANNEILRLYALCGVILPLLAKLSARTLLIISVILLALHMAVGSYIGYHWLWVYFEVLAGNSSAEPIEAMERALGAYAPALDAQIERHLGSYEALIAARLPKPLSLGIVAIVMLPITLSTMIFGMALFRSGFLTATWKPKRYARVAGISFAISGTVLAALAAWAVQSGFHAVVIAFNTFVWSAPFDMLMTYGWAAALLWLVKTWRASPAIAWVAAAGRMALSNYVLTSVLLGFIFFGYGLGLYSAIGRSQAYLYALVPIAAMLAWSKPWLDHFHYGPFEWLWRSLATFKRQPLRKPR
ncbi:MAG: DUF418 domain-containing protein [Pseudomonadota bacterium]